MKPKNAVLFATHVVLFATHPQTTTSRKRS